MSRDRNARLVAEHLGIAYTQALRLLREGGVRVENGTVIETGSGHPAEPTDSPRSTG